VKNCEFVWKNFFFGGDVDGGVHPLHSQWTVLAIAEPERIRLSQGAHGGKTEQQT